LSRIFLTSLTVCSGPDIVLPRTCASRLPTLLRGLCSLLQPTTFHLSSLRLHHSRKLNPRILPRPEILTSSVIQIGAPPLALPTPTGNSVLSPDGPGPTEMGFISKNTESFRSKISQSAHMKHTDLPYNTCIPKSSPREKTYF